MNKETVKRLLKDQTCNNCHHCFDNDRNQICWINVDKMVNLPKTNTCEKFRRDIREQAEERLIRKWW